ncbi:hypothetical protein KD5_01020 [Yersinia pseudotuberculosis]|uniref:hypothetical protein n=1 Tax=Yersinia pseudotuberculosis complex TaxID=1649845 RepID=UPI0005E0CF41|nr:MULTISPECIES: hypothetical protein [Yersinia pseudotuberculosis complex]BCU88608.1 hypothetical protein YP72344_01030 [Yersinia pseudotuberculosis]CNF63340.1 Uncharacterised protein [Yersinia similis]CNK90663.1 Uncharacterised protein [Yersinia pseudotuberculosis]
MKTITGRITKTPKRIKTQTGKIMAVATIQVETDKRTPYPLCVVGFDLLALELMLCQFGQRITVAGRSAYWNGYQVTASHISY